MATQTATYSVQVNWGAASGNAFRLDISSLDGSDVLTDQFTVDFSGTYDELVGMEGYGVKSVRIRRGRDDALSAMTAGEATIVLNDPDGRFNPQNASSPLAGDLLPMRQVRIRATNDGGSTYHGLFRGFIRSIEHNPSLDVQETTINAVDLFLWMSRVKVGGTQIGPGAVTTGIAMSSILGSMGWDQTDLIDLDDGDTFPIYRTDGSSSALSLVEDLLEAERGVFYISGSGVAMYESRHARSLRTSEATITSEISGLRAGTDLDQIVNRISVTRVILSGTLSEPGEDEEGEEQTATNGQSQVTYGLADGPSITSPYIDTDVQALSLARYIVAQRGDPRSPLWALELSNRDPETLTTILERELQDRVTVTSARGGTDADFHVEAIEHEITDGGLLHRARWVLSERGSGNAFVVGASLVGSTDVITY